MQKWLTLSLLFTTLLSARESGSSIEYFAGEEVPLERPWLTGPLLTPSGHVVPTGHQNYEPYVYWTESYGSYNSHWNPHSTPVFTDVLTQFSCQFGVAPMTEFDINPQFVYNKTQGQHMWRVSDLPITLAFQLLRHSFGHWYPAIKLRFATNIPLGKYDNLKPDRLGTDIGGIGNWLPNVGLIFTKLHHIKGHQFFAWRLFPQYLFSTPVPVKNISAYGGTKGTRGTVRPGNIFSLLLGMEYSLTQNWVLALDFQYLHNNKLKFSGHSPLGTKPASPSKEQFALAPAIEYNWSPNLGIIAGPWFTVAGRNSARFISYVVAINIYN
jgi:hypothetical protein